MCTRSLIDVECPYKVIGCEVGLLVKREIDEHMKECQILHQQLLLKKVIGSNEQRRSVKKKYGLEKVWILSAVIVLGVSVFVQYQTQNDNKIEILKKQFEDELNSFKNNIENKLLGMENTLDDRIDDKIFVFEKKMEMAFRRMYEHNESRYSQGIIMDILNYVFSSTKRFIGTSRNLVDMDQNANY